MKSFFTKLGGLLLCGVMFTAVGCHDYAEDIKDVNDRLDKIDGVLSGDSEGVAKDLAALKATVAALDATYATEAELEKAVGDLQKEIEGEIAAALTEATTAIEGLQNAVAGKADKSELEAAETEFAAKIGELRAAMETAKTEMQNALAGLDAKYVAQSVYDAAITEINGKLDGIADTYLTKEDFNSAKALITETLGALDTKVKAVEGSIETLEETLASKADKTEVEAAIATAVQVVADKVSALETTVGDLNTKLGEAQEAIKNNADAIAEVKGNLATEVSELEAAIALKADQTAVDALDTDLKALDAVVGALETTVALKANQADLEAAKTALQTAIDAKADASVVEALEGRVKTIEGEIDTLESALETAQSELEAAIELKADKTALDEVQSTLQAAIDSKVSQEDYDAKVEELVSAIAGKVAQADFDKAIAALKDSIDALAKENKEAHESLQDYTAAVKAELRKAVESLNEEVQKLHNQISELQAELKKLASSSNVSEAEIAQLFSRIQSVVFRPEYADGKARVEYAKAGNETLEGYSYITYKVFPVECAKTIADAINQKEGTPALTASFDAFKAKSANTELLEVVSAESDVDGCLTLQYKANLGADFYTSTTGYNAALILAETREDNPQIFSTEYANFVAGDVKSWEMVLYVGDEKYVAENEAYNITWPYVKVGKDYKTILADLNVRFTDGTETLKPVDFTAKYGYDSDYKTELVDAYVSDKDAITLYVEDLKVQVTPGEKAVKSFVGAFAQVDYEFTWHGMSLKAAAKAIVEDFPYVLGKEYVPTAEGGYGALHTYKMPYVDKANSVEAGIIAEKGKENFRLIFTNTETNEVVAASKLIAEYPALVIEREIKTNGKADLFDVVEPKSILDAEGNVCLASVSLDESVTFENVNDKMSVLYYFDVPVLEAEKAVGCGTYTFEISGMQYNYVLTSASRIWNYTEDAKVDAGLQNQYCFSAEIKLDEALSDKIVVDDVALSQALQRGNPKYSGVEYKVMDVTDAANPVELAKDSYVLDLGSEDNSTVVKVKFAGMEFDKYYTITAYNSIDKQKADGTIVAAAEVYVTFDLKTLKLVDENALALELPESTYELEPNLVITDQIADKITEDLLADLTAKFAEENKGKGFDAKVWFEDALVAKLGKVSNDLAFGETTVEGITANNLLDITADAIYTKYHYASKHFEGLTIPTELTYTKEITTYYGQEIVITKPIRFTLPEYTLVHSEFLVDNVNGAYQSYIQPSWAYAGDMINGFTVQDINMNDAFLLKKGEAVLSKEDLKTASLDLVFSTPVGENLPTITANVMTYKSPAETAPVSAELFLVNKVNGAEYNRVALPIANAEEYAGYFVKKYDPLLDLAATATLTERVLGKGEYTVNVAKALNLKDKLGNDFVKDGVVTSAYDYSNNFFGIAMSVDVAAAEASRPVEMKDNVTVTPILNGDKVVDCEVKFNFTTELQMLKDLEVKVPVKLTYTWGETETEITVKFLAPVK